MMHKQTKKNINELENEEKELIENSIFKRDLLKLFEDYKSSRNGFITILFRNRNLTKEKISIVDDTIKFIKNFEGSKGDLIEELRKRRVDNAEASRQHGKYHFNLMGRREETRTDYEGDSYTRQHIEHGESSRKSGLAALFHDAIEIVNKPSVKSNIRNTIK